ncbi:MAG TPA: sulfatase [Candidatus Merdenecus merdavium]|nr:sulfatase [Candidatus Merdenecus merdavium]
MKAIMVMYDSLNRHMLEPYGGKWVKTPNFTRLAEKSVTFDCNYIGSMPCMPARRELHTGRYNFLHRGWGPIEPFDDSMPEILKNNKIYTHLISDHQHYWEDGGCTYHTRYSSWEASRGQEGDPWKVTPELIGKLQGDQKDLMGRLHAFDEANRQYIDKEEKMPQAVTFQGGLDFIEKNHQEDDWFIQIETFDPHEPFFTQEEYKELYPHEYDGPMGDWPPYYFVQEDEASVSHMKHEYAALMSMCDHYLGKVLDAMDHYNLWEDTLLIVNTDHGYLIGEHGWWSKTVMPVYQEIANTPLFIYDPRTKIQGERRNVLTQTIDLPATILDFFNVNKPKDMLGKSLLPVIENGGKIRDYALFGYHEGHINITDGRYIYMLAPDRSKPFYEYTLMPTHMRSMFNTYELQDIQLQEPFSFTKNCMTMKIKAGHGMTDAANYGTRLYDIIADPKQEKILFDIEKEVELLNEMIKLLNENDCPVERYQRFGLPMEPCVTKEIVEEIHSKRIKNRKPKILQDKEWDEGAINMYHALMRLAPSDSKDDINQQIASTITKKRITETDILNLISVVIPESHQELVKYMVILNGRTD